MSAIKNAKRTSRKVKKRTVVPNIPTLKSMAKAGLIKLHTDTGKQVVHWTGQSTIAYYVDDIGEDVRQPFVFKGRSYRLKYFDGCFNPFVVDIEFAKEIGVDLDANLIA